MVFYADDDGDDLEVFTDIVSGLGRKVMTFAYGDALISQLKNPPPVAGIIFLDINMPMRSGFDILEEIRAAERWRDLPVVMLSTSDNPDNVKKCMELGANFYICKSPNFKKLSQSISKALTINWQVFQPSEKEFFCA